MKKRIAIMMVSLMAASLVFAGQFDSASDYMTVNDPGAAFDRNQPREDTGDYFGPRSTAANLGNGTLIGSGIPLSRNQHMRLLWTTHHRSKSW